MKQTFKRAVSGLLYKKKKTKNKINDGACGIDIELRWEAASSADVRDR